MNQLNSTTWKDDIIKNAELDKYTGEPKDEINAIVGDDKQLDFYPQVKLCRFSNEVNFSVRLKENETGIAKISTAGEKIIWDKGNLKAEFFPYTENEGGFKFVWYLKEKPLTNKVEFTIQSKGLDFFYQPPLTQEYQNGYSEEFGQDIVVSETQVKDLDGNVLVERPENVVGSYAVYHSTKGGMNDAYGKDYKCGKAFHIYRPHLIDANGLEAWGNLHIENGIYSEEIPQDFLDGATYPIRSNATFGYESAGGNNFPIGYKEFGTYCVRAGSEASPASSGTLDNIKAYLKVDSGESIRFWGIVNQEDSIGADSHGEIAKAENTVTRTAYTTPETFTLGSQSITASTSYILNVYGNGNDATANLKYNYVAYDTTGAVGYYEDTYATYTVANPWNMSDYGTVFKYSIYATYTPSGGGTNMKVNIGDTAKTITKAQLNIGDSWKNVTKAQVNLGDTWKTIF